MKQTKREFMPLYSYYDRTGISRHLETQAAKGWMLEKLGAYSWRYRRTEPRRLRFSATYFPVASQFDPYPSEGLETFRDFCEAAGWILAADSAQMQIFYHENLDAVPIETDPAAEFDNIHRTMKRSFLPSYWSLLALSIFEIAFGLWRIWDNPAGLLSSPLNLSAGLGWTPLLLLIIVELARYYRWRRKAKAAAEAGAALPKPRSSKALSILVLVLAGIQILWMLAGAFLTSRRMALTMVAVLLYMGLMFFLANTAKHAMKRLRFSRWVNMAVTFGVIIVLTAGMMGGMIAVMLRISGSILDDKTPAETYEHGGMTWEVWADPIPLRIEDLVETDYDGWSTRLTKQSSPLLTHIEASQDPRMDALDEPDLEYEIVIVKADFLYGLCRDDFIRWVERWNDEIPEEFLEAQKEEYRPVDLPAWGTAEVYQRYNGGEPRKQYLVCWPERIAEVHFPNDWEITPELMATAAEKLRSA